MRRRVHAAHGPPVGEAPRVCRVRPHANCAAMGAAPLRQPCAARFTPSAGPSPRPPPPSLGVAVAKPRGGDRAGRAVCCRSRPTGRATHPVTLRRVVGPKQLRDGARVGGRAGVSAGVGDRAAPPPPHTRGPRAWARLSAAQRLSALCVLHRAHSEVQEGKGAARHWQTAAAPQRGRGRPIPAPPARAHLTGARLGGQPRITPRCRGS